MPRKPDAREYVADRNLLQVAVPSNRDGCHARTPYASLMATLLCVIGVIMFAIMMTWSFNTAIEQTRRTLSIDKVPWIDRVQIGLYIIVPIMSLSSLFLLFVGFLSTGSTREELYGNAKSRKGGRSACAIAIVLSYVLTIVWISIIAFTAITVFIYYVFSSLCSSLPSYTESDCVDLGLLKRLTKGFPDANLRLCGADVQQFCAFTTTAFTTIVVAYIGASILLLGLMQFLVCNGANYAHVTNNKRYLELKGVIYSEDGYEKNVLNSGGPVHQKPGFNIETTRRAEDGRQNAPSFAGTQRKRSAENEYYNQYNSFSRKRPY